MTYNPYVTINTNLPITASTAINVTNWRTVGEPVATSKARVLQVGQVWQHGPGSNDYRYIIESIEDKDRCTLIRVSDGKRYTRQDNHYILRNWTLVSEEEEEKVGSYDEVVIGNKYGQIKLFGNEFAKYEIGDHVVEVEGYQNYSIAMKEGGFVNINEGIVVSWTDTPGHRDATFSKDGTLLSSGDPDTDIWLEEELQAEGYFFSEGEVAKLIKGKKDPQKEPEDEEPSDPEDEEYEEGEVVALVSNGKCISLARIEVVHKGTGDEFETDQRILYTLSRFDGVKGGGQDGGWAISKEFMYSMTRDGVHRCPACETYFHEGEE